MAELDAIRTHLAAWYGLADWAKDANGRRSAGVLAEDCEALLAEVERLRDGIRQHREAAQSAVPGPWLEADRRLWALLDDRTETP